MECDGEFPSLPTNTHSNQIRSTSVRIQQSVALMRFRTYLQRKSGTRLRGLKAIIEIANGCFRYKWATGVVRVIGIKAQIELRLAAA